MSIEYVEGTLSPGALVCVIHITDGELDFGSIKVITIPGSRSDNFTILAVPSGNYRVITFDLERNFLPRMPISIAADSRDIYLLWCPQEMVIMCIYSVTSPIHFV